MTFSERNGLTPKKALQLNEVNLDLRTRLWNFIYDIISPNNSTSLLHPVHRERFRKIIWTEFLKLNLDLYYLELKKINTAMFMLEQTYKNWIFKCEWYRILDLIENLVEFDNIKYIGIRDKNKHPKPNHFKSHLNRILEQENSGYRIIDGLVTPITSENELNEIEEALEVVPSFESVNVHLSTALKHLSDRANPDYRNSIKESISAVESVCKIITNEPNKTLGDALKIFKKQKTIDNGLISGLETLWGWSSNVARHGQSEIIECTFADAKLILVLSSGIVNYLKMLKKA